MARDPKIEVAAINIRISEEFDRDYPELITKLAALRKGVRVFGDSYVAISQFDKNTNIGVFSKYTEIDINGEWFDIDSFDVAAPEKIEEINIPKNLRPNYAAFYFQLDPDLHVVAFATYSDSKGLSARSVEKYFEQALMAPEIHGVYGRVEADSIKSYEEVEKILSLPDLRELQLIIRPPNTDDIGPNFARIIEDRLRAQNADEYAEILRSRDAGSLTPNDRTHQLGKIAAENGEVRAKSIVNGILTDHNTSERPLVEATTYKAEHSEFAVFKRLAKLIFGKVSEARNSLNG